MAITREFNVVLAGPMNLMAMAGIRVLPDYQEFLRWRAIEAWTDLPYAAVGDIEPMDDLKANRVRALDDTAAHRPNVVRR